MPNPILSILKIISMIFVYWVVIHILAFAGVFISLSYPIIWLLSPKSTICLFCNSKLKNRQCYLCKQSIDGDSPYPKTFESSLKNGFLIFLISVLSIGIVFIESKILRYFGFPKTPQTVTLTIPPQRQYRLGEIFPMKIELVGIEVPINAVQTDISFDPRKLQVMDISTEESFANIFIQKRIDNETGYARLTGGLPNPGFFSDKGVFGSIYFKGIQPGITTIKFLPSSMVLANDGNGTNIIKEFESISYMITPETISPQELSQQTVLFSDNVLGTSTVKNQLTFYEESNVLGVSDVAPDPQTTPDNDQSSKGISPLNILSKINNFVLNFWKNIGERIKSLFSFS